MSQSRASLSEQGFSQTGAFCWLCGGAAPSQDAQVGLIFCVCELKPQTHILFETGYSSSLLYLQPTFIILHLKDQLSASLLKYNNVAGGQSKHLFSPTLTQYFLSHLLSLVLDRHKHMGSVVLLLGGCCYSDSFACSRSELCHGNKAGKSSPKPQPFQIVFMQFFYL